MECKIHYADWETQSLFIHAKRETLEHLRHHVTYSGASYEYIASFVFELPKVLHVLGWKNANLRRNEQGQMFLSKE